jgi:transposase
MGELEDDLEEYWSIVRPVRFPPWGSTDVICAKCGSPLVKRGSKVWRCSGCGVAKLEVV